MADVCLLLGAQAAFDSDDPFSVPIDGASFARPDEVDLGSLRRRLQEQRRSGDMASTAGAVAETAGVLRTPQLYGTLIVLLAVLPLIFLGGVTEAFSRPAAPYCRDEYPMTAESESDA